MIIDLIVFKFGQDRYAASVYHDGTCRMRKWDKHGYVKLMPHDVIPAVLQKLETIMTRRAEGAA